jgi:hypothetical protein
MAARRRIFDEGLQHPDGVKIRVFERGNAEEIGRYL